MLAFSVSVCRRVIASFVFLLSFFVFADRAGATEYAGGWEIEINKNNVCIMSSQYHVTGNTSATGGVVMTITDDLAIFQLLYWRSDYNLKKGDQYKVDVSVDDIWYGKAYVEVKNENTFSIVMPTSVELLKAMMLGSKFYMQTSKTTLSLTLQGTKVAIPILTKCAYGLARKANPFGDDDRLIERGVSSNPFE